MARQTQCKQHSDQHKNKESQINIYQPWHGHNDPNIKQRPKNINGEPDIATTTKAHTQHIIYSDSVNKNTLYARCLPVSLFGSLTMPHCICLWFTACLTVFVCNLLCLCLALCVCPPYCLTLACYVFVWLILFLCDQLFV